VDFVGVERGNPAAQDRRDRCCFVGVEAATRPPGIGQTSRTICTSPKDVVSGAVSGPGLISSFNNRSFMNPSSSWGGVGKIQ